MFATRSLIPCAAIYVISFLHVHCLVLDPAIDRLRHGSLSLAKVDPIQCPFASMTKWFRKPTTITDFSDVSKGFRMQYTDIRHIGTVERYSTTSESTIPSADVSLSTFWNSRYIRFTETAYRNALALKCPFFKRRATDILEFTDNTMRELLGENIASLGPAIALRGIENGGQKMVGLSVEELTETIRKDWREATNKGYYITGRLTTNIYRDDCLFDGPDPDMPIRGIRKYMNAASQLFEYKSSTSKLLSLHINENGTVVAKWRFNGTMRLPWKPKLPEVTGTTTYHVDSSGLIYEHIETWDISAFQAFLQTFFPKLSNIIWKKSLLVEQ